MILIMNIKDREGNLSFLFPFFNLENNIKAMLKFLWIFYNKLELIIKTSHINVIRYKEKIRKTSYNL